MGNEYRRAIKTGEEQDVHTGWRKMYVSLGRAGVTAKAKRRTRRRERREGHAETEETYATEWHDLAVRGWYDYITDRALDDNPMSLGEAERLGRHCVEAWNWWAESRNV